MGPEPQAATARAWVIGVKDRAGGSDDPRWQPGDETPHALTSNVGGSSVCCLARSPGRLRDGPAPVPLWPRILGAGMSAGQILRRLGRLRDVLVRVAFHAARTAADVPPAAPATPCPPAHRRHRRSTGPHRPEALRPHPSRAAHQAHRRGDLHHRDHTVKSPRMGPISRKLRAVALPCSLRP